MNIERLTTSLQFLGAALALPAGAAGVYSAYHTYFSPAVACQEMRNATLTTLEKNIPVDAKRALLRTEVGQFESKCGEIEPETVVVFQVALQDLDKPAPHASKNPPGAKSQGMTPQAMQAQVMQAQAMQGQASAQQATAPQPPAAPPPGPAAAAAWPPAAPAPARTNSAAANSPAANSPANPGAIASLSAAGPALMAAGSTPASAAAMRVNPAPAGAPRPPGVSHAARGWVAIEVRRPGKVTETFFSGYPADGQSLPAAGTLLTAVAFRPIWSEPQGQGPIDPTKLQGRLKSGECVRVLGTAASLGRQWAEIEPAVCP